MVTISNLSFLRFFNFILPLTNGSFYFRNVVRLLFDRKDRSRLKILHFTRIHNLLFSRHGFPYSFNPKKLLISPAPGGQKHIYILCADALSGHFPLHYCIRQTISHSCTPKTYNTLNRSEPTSFFQMASAVHQNSTLSNVDELTLSFSLLHLRTRASRRHISHAWRVTVENTEI